MRKHQKNDNLKIYFSDYFEISERILEEYGAVNISLINDLPLFIDPFLLFNSTKPEYQAIHSNIIKYLLFLQEQSEKYSQKNKGMINGWFRFPEIKQTWLGFSLKGNAGRGMGCDFANHLYDGLTTLFRNFGKETITKSSHLEKLCLISPLVGRDKISDFTTNFTKEYLLEYTQSFARNYLRENQCQRFMVPKVAFNYDTRVWVYKEYYLPYYNNDYVLLTPKDMLTRDTTFINRQDMVASLERIAPAVEDETLRFALNQYLADVLPKKKAEMTVAQKEKKATALLKRCPEIIDYYIKYKEDNGDEAQSISEEKVAEVEAYFNLQLPYLVELLNEKTKFYSICPNSYQAVKERVMYLKKVIEDMDGYKVFYHDGKAIARESDIQIMYRLVWYASDYSIDREVNNGRGPVDYKVSKGSKDSTLVEFKLAKNTKLKKNLENQVEIYKKANHTENAIKVILFFSDEEYKKVIKILDELDLRDDENIVLIDARNNKVSASNA